MSSAYLDNNATTAVAADVLEAMLPYFRAQPGNPSSLHGPGEAAFAAISEARRHVARLLDAPRPEGITFTGSATEATNMAAHAARLRGRQTAITSTVEHAATQNSLAARFAHVHAIGVDRDGHLDEAAALQQIKTCGDDLALVSLLWVNNETGHIQDSAALARLAKAAHDVGAWVHIDVVQAAGKLPIHITELGADLASLSAHKLHGPKGVGALWIAERITPEFAPLIHGGPQERERRAGTENVPGIVGFGRAAELAHAFVQDPAGPAALRARRDRLEAALLAELVDITIAAQDAPRVGSTANVEFHGIDGEAALMLLAQYGIAVSTGSACGSSHHGPSHVLLAMGRNEAQAASSLRFSLSRETTDQEIDLAIATIPGVIQTLRTLAGA
jgi:cysteine desulfurase